MAAASAGWLWLALAGSGWLWLALAGWLIGNQKLSADELAHSAHSLPTADELAQHSAHVPVHSPGDGHPGPHGVTTDLVRLGSTSAKITVVSRLPFAY